MADGFSNNYFTKKQIISVFLAALVLRLLYLGLVGSFGGDFANSSDSGKFLKRAMNLLTYGEIVFVEDGIITPDTARMPIYPYFLASIFGMGRRVKLASIWKGCFSHITGNASYYCSNALPNFRYRYKSV